MAGFARREKKIPRLRIAVGVGKSKVKLVLR